MCVCLKRVASAGTEMFTVMAKVMTTGSAIKNQRKAHPLNGEDKGSEIQQRRQEQCKTFDRILFV